MMDQFGRRLMPATFRRVEDLLSPEDLKALHDDLARIAKQRRKGEAEAAFTVIR